MPRVTNGSYSGSMTSVALSFRATRIARLSRVNSSTMHSIRNALSVVGAVSDEVVGLDMAGAPRSQPDA